MATSLAEQLKKLRTPQTAILLDDKKRYSLLFDPKEAANLDKETALSIGQSGLDELIKLSDLFVEFRDNLFAQSSINLERSVHDIKVNKRLDAGIERFLTLLSPYFLLNTAHKALEWLIYRFRIHQYNKDQFLLLILPYHETRIFVRALQLVELTDPGNKWHWLRPLQKPGVPLASTTLINRVSSDNGLLKMICTHVIAATKAYGAQAGCLSTLYSFYTTALVGSVDRLSTITEVQIGHMLPTLLKGLASKIPDFAASSYMVLSKLLTKIKLKDDTMEKLLLKTFKRPCLKQEAMLLLLFLYDSAFHRLTYMPGNVVHRLAELPWFVEIMIKLQSMGLDVTRLVVPLIQSACYEILTDTVETVLLQSMVNNIISSIKLQDSAVDTLLSSILKENFSGHEISKEYKDFLAHLYQSLEKGYPERFDNYLKSLMNYSDTDSNSKTELQFLTSWQFGEHDTHELIEILDRLVHTSAEQRIIALEALANDDVNIPESFQEMTKNMLKARFSDSEISVVRSLLTFPVQRLTKLLPTDTIVDELLVLLSACHNESRKILAKPALKILLELCDEGDDTSIFITTLPYLFPNKEKDVDIAMEILLSNFAKRNSYMQKVKAEVGRSPNAETVASTAFHNILNWELLPPTENILNAMKHQMSRGDAVSMFFNMILLGSVCRVPVGSLKSELAREVIEMATEMLKKYPLVKLLPNCNNLTGNNIQSALELTSNGILPLQVGTYVLEMVHRRLDLKSNPTFDFDNNSDRSNLILRLLEMFFEGMDNKHQYKHYSRCLQIFFQRHFRTMKDLIRFLSQLYIKPVKVQTSFHCLQISIILLEQCKSMQWAFSDKVFMTNLLLSLAREHNECRVAAIDILKKLTQTFNLTMEPFSVFLQELVSRSPEIYLDPDQLSFYLYTLLSPDPDVSGQLKSDVRKKLQQVQQQLFEVITDVTTPIYVKSQLLTLLVHVNGPTILQNLAPLGFELLRKLSTDKKNESTGKALKNILERFNSVTAKALTDERVWQLFENALLEYKSQVSLDQKMTSPSAILLKQIDETFFNSVAKVSNQLQAKIFGILVDIATDCDVGNVISSAGRVIRRVRVNAHLIVEELQKMNTFKDTETESKMSTKKRASHRRSIPNPIMINSRDWKRGVTLLEFVQRTENIEKEELLYPVLFDLLKTCLSFEEQGPIEYTNQLILSTIHRLITKKLPIRDAHLQVDLIAQCIRTSRNPQTHHHALLLLVELLKVVDVRCALYIIMPIFTFMGSSVVRQDDAYSIQIISKTLETVVPIVNAADDEIHACEILRTFIVSLPDIPEHRRTPLFVKLLQLLDNHLHLYYLLTFESHVLSRTARINNEKTQSQRLEFALNVSKEFPPERLLRVCVKLAQFMKDLPVDIEDENDRRTARSFPHKHIFDIAKNTPKHLRHFKYTLVQFLGKLITMLSSTDFINRIAEYGSEEINEIRPQCDALIIELVILIHGTSKNADLYQGKPIAKYWKVLLHHLYDALDLVNNLLPNNVFLISIKKLLEHELLSVRRKSLELLNARLQQKKFSEEDHADLLELIGSLLEILDNGVKPESQENEVVQQTVLITLKLLAKSLASKHPEVFKPILEMTTELLRTRDGPILGSAALCVAELCSCLRTYAIKSLNKFMPAIIRLLETHCHEEIPDVVTISIVSAFQKIVESVGNFLSLYLDQLLYELTRLNSFYTDTEHPKIGIVVSRLKATTQKLASFVPLRVLLPAINRTYDKLFKKKLYKLVPPLLSILSESFVSIPPGDLNAMMPDLVTFFLKVFQFREDVIASEDYMEVDDIDISKEITLVEESAGKALVAVVLKLSEATFRPLYYRFYDWAARNPEHKQRNITFFRLSANIAECLKSLFVLFAGHFIKHAALLLSSNNPFVSEEPGELTLFEESKKIELVESILLTLHRVFSYDANNFVNQERFDVLAQPIVDQLENTMGTKEEYSKRANELIVPCIASFANAIPDDSLHKLLVYQTLLKTRHAKAYVRSAALNALVEIARKLGEDFMPLLPETVPFLAEMLEDEDEATEKCAQNAVRTLEGILGEPLQKYF